MRIRTKSLRRALLVMLLLLALPPLSVMGFALYRGYDTLAAVRALVTSRSGETIDAARVPRAVARVEWMGHITEPDLLEASGLARSRRRPDVLWAHNDSGNDSELFALDLRGRVIARVPVRAPSVADWEDIAAFTLDATPYLVVGDIGDNYRWRRTLYLHVIVEPELPRKHDSPPVPIAWTIAYRYPDGYHDCEALAVDEAEGRVLLITKLDVPALAYSLPLRPADTDGVLIARRIASLTGIPQPTADDELLDRELWTGNAQPTAADIAGDSAVILTYRDAYLFRRKPGERWSDALGRIPARIELPLVRGREAAALSPDGRFLYVTAERDDTRPVHLFQVDLEPPALP